MTDTGKKRLITVGAGMAGLAALLSPFETDLRMDGWRSSEPTYWRVPRSMKVLDDPEKKAARKRQKKARAITRRKAR